jgi:hypothetical protein
LSDILICLTGVESKIDFSLKTISEKTSLLVRSLKEQKGFLVLDSVESILQTDNLNLYKSGYKDYSLFFRSLVEELAPGQLFLISQIPVADLNPLRQQCNKISILTLSGLKMEDAIQLLRVIGLKGEDDWRYLIQLCNSNPLALLLVASQVKDFFSGNVKEFLRRRRPTSITLGLFESILNDYMTSNHYLSLVERQVLITICRSLEDEDCLSIPPSKLVSNAQSQLGTFLSFSEILAALTGLYERGITSKVKADTDEFHWTVQPTLKKLILKSGFIQTA